jgi:hypothetical protein
MLVNRDENSPHPVRVTFDSNHGFQGPVTMTTFGSEQYVWINAGPNSHADPDGPPVSNSVDANAETVFTLPKASVTVLRGKVPDLK